MSHKWNEQNLEWARNEMSRIQNEQERAEFGIRKKWNEDNLESEMPPSLDEFKNMVKNIDKIFFTL